MTFLSPLRDRLLSPSWDSEFHWAGGFFLLFAVIGLLSFRSFGVPYDEGTLSQLGLDAYAYVFDQEPYPTDPHYRFHGTAVELPITMLMNFFDLRTAESIVYLRRLSVFFFFFLAVASFYALARKIFPDWRIALIGAVFFVASPRIFAHGFYNSRDIPAMALFTLAALTLMRLLERRTVWRSVVHGIVCGFAIGIRMPALFLLPLTALFLGLAFLHDRNALPKRLQDFSFIGLVVIVSSMLTTYIVWPLLWEHPVRHFLDAYAFMSTIESPVEFLGKTYSSLPWLYVPGWIAFTTPLLYTVLAAIGSTVCIVGIARQYRKLLSPGLYGVYLPLIWFFLPIALLVLGKSLIYQEWRHVLFLYPAFLLLSLHGLVFLASLLAAAPVVFRRIVPVFLFVPLLSTVFWMVRNHPHDQVYYAVPRAWISETLEIDYWGLSSKQALEWLSAHIPEDKLVSFGANQNIVLLNGIVYFVSPDGPKMLPLNDPQIVDYLVTIHHPGEADPFASLPELHSIVVDGMKLATIHEGYPGGKKFMDDMRAHPEKLKAMLGM